MASSDSGDAALGRRVIAAWTRVWGLHQLAPFANVALGITAGAIDNWPIQGALQWWHWHMRLPLVLAAMAWPWPVLAFCAHACNLAMMAAEMPLVWDHMCWASLSEMAFVAAMLACRFAATPWTFLAAARTQTSISYACAAFWKLTTSFLDPRYSCGTLLVAELLSTLPEAVFPPHGIATNAMLRAAPLVTVVGEFAVGLLLAWSPHLGILLGLGFHLTILLLPVNAAGGFSVTCATAYFFFVPRGAVFALDLLSSSVAFAGAAGACVAALFAILKATHDATFAIFLALSLLAVCAIGLERRHPPTAEAPCSVGWGVRACVAFLALFHGLLGPILGLQQMAALTMYSNLQHWGGSNHLLVPTALLQDAFADAPPGALFAGAFAGGAVRVDASDLPASVLRSPADARGVEPARVRQLLQGVGNPGLFYVPYYARMAANDVFDEVHNESSFDWRFQPFAVPAFELRRLLAIARTRGEPFMLNYTALPREARSPRQWAHHVGPQVHVAEDPRSGAASCTVAGGEACAADEVAMLPAPPRWLAALLLPYPVPLQAETAAEELHCVV